MIRNKSNFSYHQFGVDSLCFFYYLFYIITNRIFEMCWPMRWWAPPHRTINSKVKKSIAQKCGGTKSICLMPRRQPDIYYTVTVPFRQAESHMYVSIFMSEHHFVRTSIIECGSMIKYYYYYYPIKRTPYCMPQTIDINDISANAPVHWRAMRMFRQ